MDREPLRLLDLFSGIGGFSLGLERTGGFKTVAFCEVSAPCRHLLNHHWPEVPCYDDIRNLTAERLAADGIGVDAICGGFPCQDISFAGQGEGIEGERSGLWREYARIIGTIRPEYVIVENVSALRSRGLGTVLGDLAAIGYDAEWDCKRASDVGAPHRRDRMWIVAYPARIQSGRTNQRAVWERIRSSGEQVAPSNAKGEHVDGTGPWSQSPRRNEPSDPRWWQSEPDVGRVAHGVPARVDRLHGLGNAVVPQIPEIIGRAILNAIGRP